MNTNSPTSSRPALDTFACVNERCLLYGQMGQDKLTVRKTYGKDGIRYLHCRCCGAEFSERSRCHQETVLGSVSHQPEFLR